MYRLSHFKSRLWSLARSLFPKIAILSLIIMTLSWLFIPAPDPVGFPVSPTVYDDRGYLLNARLSADSEWLVPLALSDMGHWLPKVAVAVEDKRFFNHPGIDPLALMRAVSQNLSHGQVISGASTITVQVVRLSQSRPRILLSKYIEFIQALKLERNLEKEEILEIYLNRAPFGGNIRGVEAASRIYFDKKACDLSLGESTLLVALLRGPSLYRPDRRPALAQKRRDFLLDILEKKGTISSQEAQRAKLEPVTPRGRMPRRIPHLADRLLAGIDNKRWHFGAPGFKGLTSTINTARQDSLEMRLARALSSFPPEVTGAGAVMDNHNGRVVAYVGNIKTSGPGSYVDCVKAFRSPGSTLKPFVYLAAFAERGLTPASLLADTPYALFGRAPRNFDGKYRGPVSAREALADSLNVPAVRVLNLVGRQMALDTLDRAGFTLVRGRNYGDSLILGGCEVSLEQLLGAYGLLATGGLGIKPQYLPDVANNWPMVFSKESVWLVNQSLRDDSRLPPGQRGDNLAFKTGTSHGYRDAWLAVYNTDYTAVLWLGDPKGRSHENLTGLGALGSTAVSLMRDLKGQGLWPDPPEGLERYGACAVSGELAGPNCPLIKPAFRLAAGASTRPCHLHVRREGQVVTLWPPELAGFMAGLESADGPGRMKPDIISPRPGGIILLEAKTDCLPLKSEGTLGTVHWFLDDVFYSTAEEGLTPVLNLSPGRHHVSLLDGRNRTARSEFVVVTSSRLPRDHDVPVLDF